MVNESKLEILKERFIQRVDKNYPHLIKYLDDKLVWSELEFIKGEILNCLMLGLGMATITLTNHFLERVMKLGLIYHDVGFVMISKIEDIEIYKEAHHAYGNQDLYTTINWCFERGLISEKTKDSLHKYRGIIRNGFSHASPEKTFGARTARFVMGSFLKPGLSEIKEVKISELHPGIQVHAINDFVEANALEYFNIVYNTLKEIEVIIKSKHSGE